MRVRVRGRVGVRVRVGVGVGVGVGVRVRDEDRAEGQDAADEHREVHAHVPRLGGDLPGDLVGAHGRLEESLLEAEEGAWLGSGL
eukprot:scaffold86360_cov57-Phaeocystis_antarctica.AAC.3